MHDYIPIYFDKRTLLLLLCLFLNIKPLTFSCYQTPLDDSNVETTYGIPTSVHVLSHTVMLGVCHGIVFPSQQ